MKYRSTSFLFLSVLAGMLMLSGCPPKKKLAIEEKPTDVVVEDPDAGKDAADAAGNQPIEITQDWTEIPALQTVQFAYDSASLDTAARNVLKTNVALLKKLPKSVTVRVEGHTDDRGTVEYNIALGQRRAEAVRGYYGTAGITKGRLEAVSFGEERPACTMETEDCWAKNRRSVTKVKNSEPITIKPGDLK